MVLSHSVEVGEHNEQLMLTPLIKNKAFMIFIVNVYLISERWNWGKYTVLRQILSTPSTLWRL